MNMRQATAIARYEILLGIRRRSLIILLLLYITGIVAFALIAKESNASVASNAPDLVSEIVPVDAQVWQGTSMVSVSMMGSLALFCVAVTFLMNESIPLDRQFRVRELLDVMPMSRATYLGGKLLGTWVGALMIVVITFLVSWGVFTALFGRFDQGFFLLMWGVFALPVVLITSATTILLTSAAGSRRAALFHSLLVIPVIMIIYSLAATSLGIAGVLLNSTYGVFTLLPPDADTTAIVSQRTRDALPTLFGVPLISWLLAWGAQRLREAR